MATLAGGIYDSASQNSSKVEELARFAIDEHNKKANATLELVGVVKVKEQVVAGQMYYLTLEAKESNGEKKLYEAKIWVKPWMDFKELQEFKELGDSLAA
ncbi:cysteine proteinase inhibitor A-like [Musa acuminata AAA Group]|uniref:cysteine proteinase inhibitor A n=1 Tax=Musa acuminata AAA Group TaxID=214697 RepID=UPI0031CEA17E